LRSNLDDATRRRILADIGIDVWRLRTGVPARADTAGSPSEDRPQGDVAGAGATVPRPRSGPAAAPAAGSPRGQESRSDQVAEPAVGHAADVRESRSVDRSYTEGSRSEDRSGRVTRPAPEAVEPFSVLSFACDGVVVLLDRVPTARERQLVRDLCAAATGVWDREPAQRRFDWPPAVIIPGAEDRSAADRALRAFVGGELADHGCTLVLLGAALAARLGELRQAGERLVIADLVEFGRDAAEKRRVWAALGRYRRAGRSGRIAGAGDDAGSISGPDPESGAP